MSLFSRIVNAIRSDARDDELDEELRFHVEEQTRRLIGEGLSPDEAARAARLRLGNAVNLRERSRDVRLLSWLDALLRDLRFGVRMLRKDGIVTGAAIASLALAMGASIAAFLLIDALILRPLPVRDPAGLVHLAFMDSEGANGQSSRERTSFNYPLFLQLQQASAGQVALFAVSYQGEHAFSVGTSADGAEKVGAQYISGSAFDELGLVPALGRLLMRADDGAAGAHPVAVLSYQFWLRRFGGDRAVIGNWVTVGRTALQVVGVAPEGFTGVESGIRTELWMPMTMYHAEALANGGANWFDIMGRLAPGVSPDAVRALLQPVFTSFRRERAIVAAPPGVPQEFIRRFVQAPLMVNPAPNGPSTLRTAFERPLWILSVVVGLVLLIACSNVANLLTARAAARDREMALRVSIGAGRGRLLQQVLIESLLIAASACALGAAFAALAAPAIIGMLAPSDQPVYLELELNWRVLGFAGLTIVLTSLLFGLAPALRASSLSPAEALKGAGVRTSSRIGLLRPLVMSQIAFSLTVIFLAGLMLLSFVRLTTVDTGFAQSGLVLANLESEALEEQQRHDGNAIQPLAGQLIDQVRQLPTVRSASLSAWGLFDQSGWSTFVSVPGRRMDDFEVYFLSVSPGFMETMGIPLRQGRDLAWSDSREAETAVAATPVIVNDAFVRRYFPDGHPIGMQFSRLLRRDTSQPQSIVGVVADAMYRDLRQAPQPTVYVPLRGLAGQRLEVRSTADLEALTSGLQVAVARVHPSLKVTGVTLQSTLIANTVLKERLLALLSAFFGLVSLTLAAIGLYGVLSYSVVRRTREIGIRLALGARPSVVARSVIGELALLTLAGLAAGLGCGLVLARFVSTLLFEVTAHDLTSLAMPVIVLLGAAILAAVPPALRATRIEPTEALRYE